MILPLRALLLLLLTLGAARADVTATVTIAGKPNSDDITFIASAANCGESPVRHTENWKIGPHGELADVVAGAPFQIINGDPTLHNILARAYTGPADPPGDTIFNIGQSFRGQVNEEQFDVPGIYTLQCNVHSWMTAWVRAFPHGCFAVTGADGQAALQLGSHLLDGTYQIDAWHPRFVDPLEQTITVKNGTAHATFQFQGPKSL